KYSTWWKRRSDWSDSHQKEFGWFEPKSPTERSSGVSGSRRWACFGRCSAPSSEVPTARGRRRLSSKASFWRCHSRITRRSSKLSSNGAASLTCLITTRSERCFAPSVGQRTKLVSVNPVPAEPAPHLRAIFIHRACDGADVSLELLNQLH